MAVATKRYPRIGSGTSGYTWTAPAGVTQVEVQAIQNFQAVEGPWGLSNTFAVMLNPFGAIQTMGWNDAGQLGIGSVTSQSSPTLIALPPPLYDQVYSFGKSVFAVSQTNGGAVYSWGFNDNGQLSNNGVTPRSTPTLIQGARGFSRLFNGGTGMFGLCIQDNLLYYLGGPNSNGGGGTNDITPKSNPTLVVGGYNFAWVGSGGSSGLNTLGLDTAGNLYGWGANTNGQLGVGDVVPRSSPTLVVGGRTYIQAFTSRDCSMALDSSGNLYGWGQNVNGQLGVGDVTPRSTPALVAGSRTYTNFILTGNGSNFAAAIASNGDLYTWGVNANGQLGLGDVTPRSTPTLVSSGSLKWAKIYAGAVNGVNNSMMLGITTSGDLYAWGANTSGQIGDGTTTPRSTPTLVSGGRKWNQLLNGPFSVYYSIFGLANNGQVYSWGLNGDGQLGQGNVTPLSSPTLVTYAVLPNITPKITTVKIPVVPGQSYGLTFYPSGVQFGTTTIAPYFVDYVDINFNQ